jgi:hypothetical protein
MGRHRNRNNPRRLTTDVTSSLCIAHALCLLRETWKRRFGSSVLARVIRPALRPPRPSRPMDEGCSSASIFARLQQQGMALLALLCSDFPSQWRLNGAPLCNLNGAPRCRPRKADYPGLSTPEHQAQRLCQTGAILDLILLSRPAEPFSSDVKVLSFFMGIVTRI